MEVKIANGLIDGHLTVFNEEQHDIGLHNSVGKLPIVFEYFFLARGDSSRRHFSNCELLVIHECLFTFCFCMQ